MCGREYDTEIQGIMDKGFESIVEAVEVYRIDIEHIRGKKKGRHPASKEDIA